MPLPLYSIPSQARLKQGVFRDLWVKTPVYNKLCVFGQVNAPLWSLCLLRVSDEEVSAAGPREAVVRLILVPNNFFLEKSGIEVPI